MITRPGEALARAERRSAPAREPVSKIDAEFVVYRLERAGAALLALPTVPPQLGNLETIRTAIESYGWTPKDMPVRPNAEEIARMDEAFGWIPLIPRDRYVLRRVVGARALVHPVTRRHLFPWTRLGKALGADHKAVQRWHTEGVQIIVEALRNG